MTTSHSFTINEKAVLRVPRRPAFEVTVHRVNADGSVLVTGVCPAYRAQPQRRITTTVYADEIARGQLVRPAENAGAGAAA